MNTFTRNILNEVFNYYNGMILNEDFSKAIKTFKIPQDQVEDFNAVIGSDPTCGQNPTTGDKFPGKYQFWLGNLFKNPEERGKLVQSAKDNGELTKLLTIYNDKEKELEPTAKLKDGKKTKEITSFDEFKEIVKNINNLKKDSQINTEEEEMPQTEKNSTGDPWVDYALGIGEEYREVHGDTPRQLGVEDKGEKLVYEDNDFIIIIPTTHEGARQLSGNAFLVTPDSIRNTPYYTYKDVIGKDNDGNDIIKTWPYNYKGATGVLGNGNLITTGDGTQEKKYHPITRSCGWCTGFYNSSGAYDNYKNNGGGADYYIIFAKHPKNEFENGQKGKINMWQFHCASGQFMGPGDVSVTFQYLQNYGDVRGVINFLKQEIHDKKMRGNDKMENWCKGVQMYSLEEAIQMMKDPNIDLRTICNRIEPIYDTNLTIVQYGTVSNIITEDRNFIFKQWLRDIKRYINDFYLIETNANERSKKNLFNVKTQQVLFGALNDTGNWFDKIVTNNGNICVVEFNVAKRDENGLVRLPNGELDVMSYKNILDLTTGELVIQNQKRANWLNGVGNMINGFSVVTKIFGSTLRQNLIDKNGHPLFEGYYDSWPDMVSNFGADGFAFIKHDDVFFIIDKNKNIYPQNGARNFDGIDFIKNDKSNINQFKYVPKLNIGFIQFEAATNDGYIAYNAIDKDGQYLIDENNQDLWSDEIIEFLSNACIITKYIGEEPHQNIIIYNNLRHYFNPEDIESWPIRIIPMNETTYLAEYQDGSEEEININSQNNGNLNESIINKIVRQVLNEYIH